MIEERTRKLTINKSGSGSTTFRVTLPATWVREMGLSEEKRELLLSFNGKEIAIKNEEELEMKAKKYEGMKVKVVNYFGDDYEEDERDLVLNVTSKNIEEFKEDYEELLYGIEDIEIVQDEPVLYRTATAHADGDLSTLCNIRAKWNRRIEYRYLMTEREIAKHLEKDYLVAVEGLGEIGSTKELYKEEIDMENIIIDCLEKLNKVHLLGEVGGKILENPKKFGTTLNDMATYFEGYTEDMVLESLSTSSLVGADEGLAIEEWIAEEDHE